MLTVDAAFRGWRDTAAWLVHFNVLFNLYPVLSMRYVRCADRAAVQPGAFRVMIAALVDLVDPGEHMSASVLNDAPALTREVLAAIDAQDLIRTAALLDDSFQLHYHGIPDAIPKATLLEMLGAYYQAFPDMRHDVLEVLPSGSYVTVRLMVHATHRGTYEGIAATERQVAVGAIHIIRTANGRIAEWWAAEDDLGLLRQIGAVISPPPGQEC